MGLFEYLFEIPLRLVIAFFVAHIALSKGRSGFRWFVLTLVIGIFGLFYVMLADDLSGRKFPDPRER